MTYDGSTVHWRLQMKKKIFLNSQIAIMRRYSGRFTQGSIQKDFTGLDLRLACIMCHASMSPVI
jgi:hypothetical protein